MLRISEINMPNLKIGVFGSAAGEMSDEIKAKARVIGREIAKNNCILVTGACHGLPFEAVLGAQEAHGQSVGFSPAIDLASHQEQNSPTIGFTNFVFVPKNYEYADNPQACHKYRNVASVAAVDAAIIISGRIGTMNEFTIAYDLGKVIGILEGSGGISDRAIKIMLDDINKETGATVIFESDPVQLVKLLLQHLA